MDKRQHDSQPIFKKLGGLDLVIPMKKVYIFLNTYFTMSPPPPTWGEIRNILTTLMQRLL